MKRRYLYMLLVGLPGLLVSLIVSFFVIGFAAGVLWIFAFGDNLWPASVEKALPVLFVTVFLILWLAALSAGYGIGRRLEQEPTLNKSHVLISAGITALSVLFIVFYQVRVGNIGTKSDETRCSELCTEKGYFASSVSPRDAGERSCGCLNSSGIQVITVPVRDLGANK